jgi:hypothetical protein
MRKSLKRPGLGHTSEPDKLSKQLVVVLRQPDLKNELQLFECKHIKMKALEWDGIGNKLESAKLKRPGLGHTSNPGESLKTQPNKLTSSPAAWLNYPCGLKPDQDEQQLFEYVVKPNHRLKTTGLRHTTESDTKQQTAKVFPNLVHLNSQSRSTTWQKDQVLIEASTVQEEVESDELRNEYGELDKIQTVNQAKREWSEHSIFLSKRNGGYSHLLPEDNTPCCADTTCPQELFATETETGVVSVSVRIESEIESAHAIATHPKPTPKLEPPFKNKTQKHTTCVQTGQQHHKSVMYQLMKHIHLKNKERYLKTLADARFVPPQFEHSPAQATWPYKPGSCKESNVISRHMKRAKNVARIRIKKINIKLVKLMFPDCDPYNLPCQEQAQIKVHMQILRGVVERHVDAKLHHKHKQTKVDTHIHIQQRFGKVSNTIRSSNTVTKAPSESLSSMKYDVSGTCEPNSNKIATITAQTFVLQPAPPYFNVKLASIQPHFSAPAKLNPLSSVFVPTTCICMPSQQVIHTEMEASPPATSRKLALISPSYTTPPRRSYSSATRTKAATGTTRSRNLNNNSRTSHWQRVLKYMQPAHTETETQQTPLSTRAESCNIPDKGIGCVKITDTHENESPNLEGKKQKQRLEKMAKSDLTAHVYCIRQGLYGPWNDNEQPALNNKEARRLRKMKLKIGCVHAAKIMVARMAQEIRRFIAAKATRIITRKRHRNIKRARNRQTKRHKVKLTLDYFYRTHNTRQCNRNRNFWRMPSIRQPGLLFASKSRAPHSGERNRSLGGPGRPGGVRAGTG